MAFHRQSERVILRRMYPFLRRMFSKGRWKKADMYLSAFFSAEGTPSSSAALLVVRFERMVAALKLGSNAFALKYYRRKVVPLVGNLGLFDGFAAVADCTTALFHSDVATLRRKHPDNDDEYNGQRAIKFLAQYRERCQQGDDPFMCAQDTADDNLARVRRAAALRLRRYARPREKLNAKFVAYLYRVSRKCIKSGECPPSSYLFDKPWPLRKWNCF